MQTNGGFAKLTANFLNISFSFANSCFALQTNDAPIFASTKVVSSLASIFFFLHTHFQAFAEKNKSIYIVHSINVVHK